MKLPVKPGYLIIAGILLVFVLVKIVSSVDYSDTYLECNEETSQDMGVEEFIERCNQLITENSDANKILEKEIAEKEKQWKQNKTDNEFYRTVVKNKTESLRKLLEEDTVGFPTELRAP